MRVRFFQCVECERKLPEYAFEIKAHPVWETAPGTTAICVECQMAEYVRGFQEHQRWVKQSLFEEAMAAHRAHSARRAAMVAAASPLWRDRDKIKAIYDQARALTDETGIMHHVDHILPIQHARFCGLHVHWNLQVLTKTQNISKLNRVDDQTLDKMGAEMLRAMAS